MKTECDTAFILSAGRGERMRPLTDRIPKPLIQVGGKPLIAHHYIRLVERGITNVIVNHAHLGEQVVAYMKELWRSYNHDVNLVFSSEEGTPLETAGGVINALELINSEQFILINADIWTDYPFENLIGRNLENNLAHLVMVPTPTYKETHDFYKDADGKLYTTSEADNAGYTFSGMSVMSTRLFKNLSPGKRPLAPLLRQYIDEEKIRGEVYSGDWQDIGTPERLRQLRAQLNHK